MIDQQFSYGTDDIDIPVMEIDLFLDPFASGCLGCYLSPISGQTLGLGLVPYGVWHGMYV